MGCVPSSENNFLRCLRIQLIEIAYEGVFFFLFVLKMWKYWRWSTEVLIVYSNGGESKWKLKAKVTNKHDSQEKKEKYKRNPNRLLQFTVHFKHKKWETFESTTLSFFFWMNVSYQTNMTQTTQHTLQTLIEIYLFIVQTNPWRKRCCFFSLTYKVCGEDTQKNNNNIRTDSTITHNFSVREIEKLNRPAFTINHRCWCCRITTGTTLQTLPNYKPMWYWLKSLFLNLKQ